MSTVYVIKFEDEDGTHMDWCVDQNGDPTVAVVPVEFNCIWEPHTDLETYNWLQDSLENLDIIKVNRNEQRAQAVGHIIDWICSQIEPYVDVTMENEADLRAWNPDKYTMLRQEFDVQLKHSMDALTKPHHNFAFSRMHHLNRLLEIAKTAAKLEMEGGAYDRWWKENHRNG